MKENKPAGNYSDDPHDTASQGSDEASAPINIRPVKIAPVTIERANTGPVNTGPVNTGPVTIERVKELNSTDLSDLCEATEYAILEGGGFGWLEPPERWVLENYWNGIVLIPQRFLWVGRLDGIVAGSIQLQRRPKANEAQRYTGTLSTLFIAPWARGYSMAYKLVGALEDGAQKLGIKAIDAAVRVTQTKAVSLLEDCGYQAIGTHPYYAHVNNQWVAGRYYTKALQNQGTSNLNIMRV